ncbi:MAG: putative peptide modification system cyclase [Pseudomonadota bacterium]|nr:putative peptide modification system cyclase [Pseudomonadota bacterium]
MNAPDIDSPQLGNPQVRTLLLTDLCDSTTLVERLGDNEAAELFRAHDRLVLTLQQQWHGRLIDRSDGLLLLFERPIDGLGFAMDYVRGLRELGEQHKVARHGVELQARSGLHVGEVLTWRNSDAAVNVGAKPLEVEGLAKPMAGRLMTLARPGQILLSATAEPLAHRAARELGERGEHLLWKSHGRWRFKGVPQVQEIYEVGEPGIAPLRAPQQNRNKAWRDIPLWRRPAALAAELVLVAGLAGGAWFMTKPQPAIAFAERDWVVVADLRNLTGDAMLDESLEQAFRISLEQSRYVNVLSDLKARDTLERMRRKPDTVLDRAIASEIALRDGARAVILPTVAEVGGRVRVSAEVIDPHTQTTVYAASADGGGAESTLGSIDEVTAELREQLGEAMQSIQDTSMPLPQATTANLDALKAFAIGLRHSAAGEPREAISYYDRAIALDPGFALALSLAGSVYAHSLGDIPQARNYYARALALGDRLGPRDALRVQAAVARLGPPLAAIERSRQLLALYPDQLDAHLTLGQLELWESNDLAAALHHARAATVPQAERRGAAKYLQGIVQLALDKPAEAIRDIGEARKLGYRGAGYSLAFAHAVQDDWDGADRALAQRIPTGAASIESLAPAERALIAADRGDWASARQLSAEATKAAMKAESQFAGPSLRFTQLAVEVAAAQLPRAELLSRIDQEFDWLRANDERLESMVGGFSISMAQALGYMAARLDAGDRVQAALDATVRFGQVDAYPMMGQMDLVLRAELERISGAPGDACRDLGRLAGRGQAMVLVHASVGRCLQGAGDEAGAAREARWLGAHRGRAYVERPAGSLLTVFAVADASANKASAD